MRRLFIESLTFSKEIKQLIKENKISGRAVKKHKSRFGNSWTWGLT